MVPSAVFLTVISPLPALRKEILPITYSLTFLFPLKAYIDEFVESISKD